MKIGKGQSEGVPMQIPNKQIKMVDANKNLANKNDT